MSVVTTTFDVRYITPDQIELVARGADGSIQTLLKAGDGMERVAHAIRKAYAFGRQDERRQTAAVLRGLMAQ